jgi:RHS repeat-associated protein
MAKANPLRFSTKYQDDETELLYYGYRYYSPSSGRWVSRDPIEEKGGPNIYGFVANDPMQRFDRLGLQYAIFPVPPTPPTPPTPRPPPRTAPRVFTTLDGNGYYNPIDFIPCDVLIHDKGEIWFTSGNQWPFAPGSNLDKVKCLLTKLGLNVPPPLNGVYLGRLSDEENDRAFTVDYQAHFVPRMTVTVFRADLIEGLNTRTALDRAIDMWHELKGHNMDNANHDTDRQRTWFTAKYDDAVRKPVNKLIKAIPAGVCGVCLPKDGPPWKIRSYWDDVMCDCGIPPFPGDLW